METRHIPFVRAVAEHRTISAAARELGMTQPALTKILLRLEDLVGARLFDRRPRGVSLTPFGDLFLQRMDRVEREMLSLTNEFEALKTGLSGTLSIGVGQFWVGRITPHVVARLLEIAPDVRVRIFTNTRDQLLTLLERGKIDLVLGRLTDDLPEDLQGEALADVHLHLTVRGGHPLTRLAREPTPEDLSPYGWVLPPASDPTAIHMAGLFRRIFRDVKPVAVEAISHNLTVSLLQSSDLITAMPGITAQPPPAGLCRLPAGWLGWSRKAGVIRVRDTSQLPCCALFLDLLRKEMRAAP